MFQWIFRVVVFTIFIGNITTQFAFAAEPNGKLRVITKFPEATIYLDAMKIGKGNAWIDSVAPGEYKISLEGLDGKITHIHKVTIHSGTTTVMELVGDEAKTYSEMDESANEAKGTVETPAVTAPVAPKELVPDKKKDEFRNVAWGTRLLYILPGLSGQFWLSESIGLEGNIWWTGFSGGARALISASTELRFNARLADYNVILGIGQFTGTNTTTSGTSSTSRVISVPGYSVGLKFQTGNYVFTPTVAFLALGSRVIPSLLLGYHWFL